MPETKSFFLSFEVLKVIKCNINIVFAGPDAHRQLPRDQDAGHAADRQVKDCKNRLAQCCCIEISIPTISFTPSSQDLRDLNKQIGKKS